MTIILITITTSSCQSNHAILLNMTLKHFDTFIATNFAKDLATYLLRTLRTTLRS